MAILSTYLDFLFFVTFFVSFVFNLYDIMNYNQANILGQTVACNFFYYMFGFWISG